MHFSSEDRIAMTMLPADCSGVREPNEATTGLEKLLRMLSVLTMLMTVPQVFAVWTSASATGVSLISWSAYLVSAALWFVYGIRKRDKTIYLACIGWILLDVAIVAGVIVRG
jgi:uncharacterized protein with PQ loop repeat